MDVEITYKTVGKWRENSYFIEYNNIGWLIDPGDEFEALDAEFDTANKNIKGIINTHGHFDHLGAVSQFKEKYSLPFYIHSKDKQILRQANLYKKLAGSTAYFVTPSVDEFLDEMLSMPFAEGRITVHHLPGHTNGSVCFEIGKNLISGDTIFSNAIGRVDLPGGNIDLLKQSVLQLTERFEDYTIYPGHGEPFVLNANVIDHLKTLI